MPVATVLFLAAIHYEGLAGFCDLRSKKLEGFFYFVSTPSPRCRARTARNEMFGAVHVQYRTTHRVKRAPNNSVRWEFWSFLFPTWCPSVSIPLSVNHATAKQANAKYTVKTRHFGRCETSNPENDQLADEPLLRDLHHFLLETCVYQALTRLR